ncbi:hypothetical protein AB0H88_14695 [Nonomuraea sp. NPDC050680]|uniref:hypothetical protein n=1 Tax=Nonomuraea sp. NPDC050680 TaxID=3154630 RepID=UPI0033E53436
MLFVPHPGAKCERVEQPAEAVASDDLDIGLDRVRKGSLRSGLAQGAMWAISVRTTECAVSSATVGG